MKAIVAGDTGLISSTDEAPFLGWVKAKRGPVVIDWYDYVTSNKNNRTPLPCCSFFCGKDGAKEKGG